MFPLCYLLCRPGRPGRTLGAGRARYTLNALLALRPSRAGYALDALWAGRAGCSLWAGGALRPRRSGHALNTLNTLFALGAGRPRCSLRAGLAGGALGTGFAARAHGAAQYGHLHRALRAAGDAFAAAHAVRKNYTIVHESSPLFSGSFARYHIYAPACRACAPQRRAAAFFFLII